MKTERLEIIRQELGLNKSQFAEAMGISRHYYYQILSGLGTNNVRLEHLENLLLNKGVNPSWIITGEGDKFIKQDGAENGLEVNQQQLAVSKKALMSAVMNASKLPSFPGELSFAILDNLVQKAMENKPELIANHTLGIEALSLAWISMLELAQQMIGQGFEFEYDQIKYALRSS